MNLKNSSAGPKGHRSVGDHPICLVVPTLARPGGAERVAVRLAAAWNAQGRSVAILSTDSPDLPAFFELPEGVTVRHLSLLGESRGLLDSLVRNVRRILAMRAAIRRVAPAVVISFIDVLNVTVVFSCVGMSVPVIAAERTAPSRAPIGRLWTLLRNIAYRMADHVVVQSQGAYRHFERALRGKLSVIANPVDPGALSAAEDRQGTNVVAIGRFTAEKGFDLLIRSFARAAVDFPDWKLTIYGEGPLRSQLEDVIAREQMTDRVFLPGVTRNASEALAAADIFVLSSHYEGFPNVLCEAMAAGVACVATDCPDGPREIVRDGVDGILVPPANAVRMAEALVTLMESRAERRRLGRNARSGIARFSLEKVLDQWDRLIDDLRPAGGRPADASKEKS